ncbi:MAG: signal peptidase II [Acidimicrobiales bacterium]
MGSNDEHGLFAQRAAVAVGCFGLDQLSKLWALDALANDKMIPLLPTLKLDLFFNSGFSFSAGSGFGRLIGLLVVAMALFLIHLLRKEPTVRRGVLLAAILGGAIGNLFDRLWRAEAGFLSGEVVDFINVSWFAVFNVADIFVVCGVILLALLELIDPSVDDKPAIEDEASELG